MSRVFGFGENSALLDPHGLAFGEASFAFFRDFMDALRTMDTGFVIGMLLVFARNGPSARKAHDVITLLEAVPHGDALIKDKAITSPFGFGFGYGLQVL